MNGHGVEATDLCALDDLGGESANLDSEEGSEQHADSQSVKHVAVDGVLAHSGKAGGEDDLENIRTHCRHGGHAKYVDEHRER